MLRHAAYSEKDGVGVIMFEYTDRDVLVNTLWATNYLKSKLYWRDRISEKIFDLSKAAQRLGRDLVEALPGFHCFTGNDHNAALIYQGKATPFQKLKKCKEAIQSFSEMGSYENVQETTIPGIRKFVLSLYATQKFQINNCKTTDVARTKMVCSGQKNAARMPMCEKVLKQHINRTNILAFLIKSPLLFPNAPCPDPINNGFNLKEDKTGYDLNWFEGSSRPEELSNAIKSCKCKQDLPCSDESCGCKKMGWRCTLACGCEGDCLNLPATHYEADSDSDDENN
jgi:hypothetical protein